MAESRRNVILAPAVHNESSTADLLVPDSDGLTIQRKQIEFELVSGVLLSGTNELRIKADGVESIRIATNVPTKRGLLRTTGQLQQPWGMALNQSQQLIVAEGRRNCVSIFNLKGDKITEFGHKGVEDREFNSPRGVAVDDQDNIFVVDKENARIQKFSSTGEWLATVGSKGYGDLEFNWPKGIGIHPHSKNVYVTEISENHRVQILKSDLTFLSKIGAKDSNGRPRKGADIKEFNIPLDVAFDSTGKVYVTDAVNNRIQVFTEEGMYVTSIEHLNWPSGICFDEKDLLYVTEIDNSCISVLTKEGELLSTFKDDSKTPHYRGIAVNDNCGMIYVTDCKNDNLLMFLK